MSTLTLIFSLSCDDVIIDQHGKKSIIGIFDNINSTNFRARHPKFALISRWTGPKGKFTFQTRLLDPSKKKVIEDSNPHEVEFPQEKNTHDDIFYLVNTLFESPGVYWIESLANGERFGLEPLNVNQIPEPTT